MSEITVRPMMPEDWTAVSKIYLEGIATEHATFQTNCPPYTAWDASHTRECRLVVLDDGVVAGWAALHRVDPRWCYRGVAEVSIYVGEKFREPKVIEAVREKYLTGAMKRTGQKKAGYRCLCHCIISCTGWDTVWWLVWMRCLGQEFWKPFSAISVSLANTKEV